MSKNITIKEGTTAKNFSGVKKISTNQMGGGSVSWIPEDEAVNYVNLKKITARQNGTYTAEDESCDGFSEVKVEVPADVKDKVITANGEYIAAEDSCLGYRKVTVNVSGGGSGSGQHTVIFYAADRTTILERVTVEDGGGAIYHGITPTSSGMRFIGWSPNPINIRADLNVYPRFENLIYDPTQITDDWITIARKFRQDPDAYNIGQWKLLELNPMPYSAWDQNTKDILDNHSDPNYVFPSIKLRMMLVAKGVDELEGGNGYAPSTWLSMDLFSYLYDSTHIDSVGFYKGASDTNWVLSAARKFLQGQFTSVLFPQDLLNYVRRIVKYTTVVYPTDEGYSYPSIDWFFVPSVREMFGGVSDKDSTPTSYGFPISHYMESRGAIYDIFCTGTYDDTKADRLKAYFNDSNARGYNLRTNDYGHQYGTNHSLLSVNSYGELVASNTGSDIPLTAGAMPIGFCL